MRSLVNRWRETACLGPLGSAVPARSRRLRRPRDARLLKLALACCAIPASGPALADHPRIPALNVAVLRSYSTHSFSTGDGTLSFDTLGYVEVSGESSYRIKGQDCFNAGSCYDSCMASVDGAVEFAIGPQSIVISCSRSLPTAPAGRVRFWVRLAGPAVLSWPGGSETLDTAAPYCTSSDPKQEDDYPLDCEFQVDLAAPPDGFPIVASAPIELLALESRMSAETPGHTGYEHQEAGFVCEPFWDWYDECLAPVSEGSWSLIGDAWPPCMCVGFYQGIHFESHADFSINGTRIDAELDVDWCQGSFAGAQLMCRIGFDRPIRVRWDDACGSSFVGVLPNACGPGSLEVWPYFSPYFGRFEYTQVTLFDAFPPVMSEAGSATLFRGENVRFERIFPADVVPDGVVNGIDISAVLSEWGGPCVPHWTAADVNLDGQVGAEDLALVLFAWGTPG